MSYRFSPQAMRDLTATLNYIADDNPTAAEALRLAVFRHVTVFDRKLTPSMWTERRAHVATEWAWYYQQSS